MCLCIVVLDAGAQALSTIMLGLVVAFGVVWLIAMLMGVTKTIQRRRASRLDRSARKRGSADVVDPLSSSWSSKLVTDTQASLQSAAVSSSDASSNFDHPGDSVFATPLGLSGNESVRATGHAPL